MTKDTLFSAVETCCGMGISTAGITEAGFRVVAANDKSAKLLEAYSVLHPDVTTVLGDICNDKTLMDLHAAAPDSACLLAGFSCQPFSSGGSQRGGLDSRACSLPGVLKAALLLRKPIIVLECVTSAATNRFVRAHLDSFCSQCGYGISEVQLKLEDVWVSRRDRWWAVLTVGALGDFHLKGWVTGTYPAVVKEVLPRPMDLSASDLAELVIEKEEHDKLSSHCNMSEMELPRNAKCPTALHAWGSQAGPCPCGCRSEFSQYTLSSRGIFGVFLALPDLVADGLVLRKGYRHLHPSELSILTCSPIPDTWPSPLRLSLCGLGQQATPLQSVWVVGQIRKHLDKLLGVKPAFDVVNGFHRIMHRVLEQSRGLMTEQVTPEPVVPCPSDVVGAPVFLPDWVARVHEGPELTFTLHFESTRHSEVISIAHDQVTVGNLRSAEVQINPLVEMWDFVDCKTGQLLPNDHHVNGLSIFVRPVEFDSSVDVMEFVAPPPAGQSGQVSHAVEEVSPTIPYTVSEEAVKSGGDPVVLVKDPLLQLSAAQLVDFHLPQIGSLEVFDALLRRQLPVSARLTLFETQGLLWADDEIRWHLRELVSQNTTSRWAVLDPLLATTACLTRIPGMIMDWYKALEFVPHGIVSCILVDGHWIPLTWTWSGGLLVCRSWDIQRPGALPLTFLQEALSLAVGARTWNTNVTHRMFSVGNACGICAVSFVASVLQGRALPSEPSEVQVLHHAARADFVDALSLRSECSRPWVWGGGLDPHAHRRLLDLLSQHGVPHDMLESRSALIVQALGLGALQKVLISSSPWRGLKALANQARPPFQLILPQELADAVKGKAEGGGQTKKKKGKGKGKGAPARPSQLDPTKLRIEAGYFVRPNNEPVAVISVGDLGPVATGIALATPSMIEQFLLAGKQVSNFPLAVVLINVDFALFETALTWSELKVPLRCTTNDDPVLVQAVLLQLGSEFVSPMKGQPLPLDVENAACVKIAVYRDSINVAWSDFVSGPVRYILDHLPCLVVCDKSDCKCGKWHADDSTVLRDPVLDVWRRQWLNLTFKPSPPEQSDIFMVNVRYAQQVERAVLEVSGFHGLFVEPRSLDGRTAVADYQVLWLHRMGLKEVMHIKQCQPNVIGAARIGSRLGIRVRAEHAVSVGALVKPDMVVLQSGARFNFEVGPVPFGLDRAAVQRLCAKWDWTVRAVNPIKTLDGHTGIVWHVQASADPPATIFKTQSGDVLVSKLQDKQNGSVNSVNVIGSAQTMDLCALRTGKGQNEDPWANYRDPWSDSLKKVSPPQALESPMQALKQVEERIEQAVLARLPKVADMEIDESGRVEEAFRQQEARVSSIEAQIQNLVQNQQTLDAKIDAASHKADAQVNNLQCQVAAQFEAQSSKMEDMFTKQMEQISTLLSKRARTHE